MRIPVVNEKDEIIGYKERHDRNQTDITRDTRIFIFNSNNEILIAQRALSKKDAAGKWGPAVDGTVEEGETYISNALKEIREELGVTIKESDLIIGHHGLFTTSHRYFRQTYYIKLDSSIVDFKIQKDEVEQIKWIGFDKLERWIKQTPTDFTWSFPISFEYFLDFINKKQN